MMLYSHMLLVLIRHTKMLLYLIETGKYLALQLSARTQFNDLSVNRIPNW